MNRLNSDNVRIECIGEEVRIYKADAEDETPDNYITGKSHPDALDELISKYNLPLSLFTS